MVGSGLDANSVLTGISSSKLYSTSTQKRRQNHRYMKMRGSSWNSVTIMHKLRHGIELENMITHYSGAGKLS